MFFNCERKKLMRILKLFYLDEKGGGLVEYALIVCLIALAAITAMTTVGTKLTTDFTSIAGKL
jgi:pilus assembly protein Flp/PilA